MATSVPSDERAHAPGPLVGTGGTTFRVWAPDSSAVEVQLHAPDGPRHPLRREESGFFEASLPVAAGTRYAFRLDDGEPLPDLASRFQPDGPSGFSELIDPAAFAWTDARWPGLEPRGQVVYEMHVGTFTRAGTWQAAAAELPALADLGVTVIEMMPVAEFPGRFGWGYDGVLYYAPTRLYGRPDDLRRFVDRAHALGMGVILDVVYNHAGPAANCFRRYTDRYIGAEATEWGDCFNYDGEDSAVVRGFFAGNAVYWLRDFHFDGLRLDATQQIFDRSTPHVVTTIVAAARAAAGARSIWVIAENEPQDSRLLGAPEAGGQGIDALWNDDFHHSAVVAATGAHEAYYSDYRGTAQELVSCATRGFLYQGQRSRWQKQPRGRPAGHVPPHALVAFLQNHDQVANSVDGRRLHALTSPGVMRALTALLLLGPWTPMLFQGQELAASSPFLYFADHSGELADLVATGREEFLGQFPSVRQRLRKGSLHAPHAEETVERSRLDHDERRRHRDTWLLHRDLLTLRRTHEAFRHQQPVEGAVLGPQAFVIRHSAPAGTSPTDGDRLLLVNLQRTPVEIEALAEPLLAPASPDTTWSVIFSTETMRYGGMERPVEIDDAWIVPPECAVVLA